MVDPFSAIIAAATWVFSSTNIVAQGIRFVGSILLNAALSSTKIPQLSDLKVQTSSYGAPIARLYGESVRIAGNVIDKSDLLPVKHKKGSILGVGGVKYYTYDVHLHILLCEGQMLQPEGIRKIWMNGRCMFDRDAPGATPPTITPEGAYEWKYGNKTHASAMATVRLYHGSPTQLADPLMQSLHPGQTISAYRHATTVVLERLGLENFGSAIPNIEFELEPAMTRLSDIVRDMTSLADVTVQTHGLRDRCRGYVVARDGSVWDALSPLAGTYAFDFVQRGAHFFTVKRGGPMRTIIPLGELNAQAPGSGPGTPYDIDAPNVTRLPDEVTVNYFAASRDYQPSSQRAARNRGVSQQRIAADVPVVLTDDEAIDLAYRTLYESIARMRAIRITLSDKYRWLNSGDLIGITVAGQIEPFRLGTITRSPNGVGQCEAAFEDALLYQSNNLTGAVGQFPGNPIENPGETVMMALDAPILFNAQDDTGFTAAFNGRGNRWRGATVMRAVGVGSPLTFETIGNVGIPALMADADTTLAAGPTDVWDYVNTVTVTMINDTDTLTSATEADVLTLGANLAWLGGLDGYDGEYFHFTTATPASPAGTYVLSGLLRGRFGTELNVGLHTSGERLVMCDDRDALYRLDEGPAAWGVARTFRTESLPGGEEVADKVFTNTGVGKSPLAPVDLRGTRNGSNDDVLISWVRRTRRETGNIAAAVPLGEDTEAYEIDIHAPGSPATVLRTLTASSPSVNYTAAMLAADGFSPGNFIPVTIYQMSGIYGRGFPAEGLV